MTQTTTDRILTAGGGSGWQGWAMKREAWSERQGGAGVRGVRA
jgi:hypothetical protein